MSSANTNTNVEAHDRGKDRSPGTTESLPPSCNPKLFIDWRLRYASHLARHTRSRPIRHSDPWVETAANAFARQHDEQGPLEPIPANIAFSNALSIYRTDSLEHEILDARLVALQEPKEIAQRCRLSELDVTAYSQLAFDVRGADRKYVRPLIEVHIVHGHNPDVRRIGHILRGIALLDSSETLEATISALGRLDGKTMADGLPARTEPEFAHELAIRRTLAKPLLPNTRQINELMERFEEVAAADTNVGRTSGESVDLTIEILRKAKIPVALQKEIRREHESRSQEAAATRAEAEQGTAI